MSKKHEIKFTLRLPPDLHERLVYSAASATPARSLNSEILARLEMSGEQEDRARDASKRLLELVERMRGLVEAEENKGRA